MSWLSAADLPRPHDAARRAVAWARWLETSPRPDDQAAALLDALFGNSPYLTEIILQNRGFAADLWHRGPDAAVAGLMDDLLAARTAARAGTEPEAIATSLRRQTRRFALAVAVADIAGVWPLERITGALSDFATGALNALTDAILLRLARDGQLAIGSDPDAAAFTVLAMGISAPANSTTRAIST